MFFVKESCEGWQKTMNTFISEVLSCGFERNENLGESRIDAGFPPSFYHSGTESRKPGLYRLSPPPSPLRIKLSLLLYCAAHGRWSGCLACLLFLCLISHRSRVWLASGFARSRKLLPTAFRELQYVCRGGRPSA
jgi:hypothetical protein